MKTLIILGVLTISTLLTGCESLSLHEANSALINYHQELESAEKSNDFLAAQISKDGLHDLAKQASSEASDTKDVAIKIALHRAAATAAWIAAIEDAQSYASAGNSVCNKEFSKAPNHCAMLAFIPNFIEIDRLTFKVEPLTASIINGQTTSSAHNAKDIIDQLSDFFSDYNDRANTAIADYIKIKKKDGTEPMLNAYKIQISPLFCSEMKKVNTAIHRMGGINEPNMCTIYAVQKAAQNAGIDANCLARDIQKPPVC